MNQRRPALGRLPWFALRRRARFLRRAFFAMRANRVAGVLAESDGWVSPHLTVARSRFSRWRGLRPRPRGNGLVVVGCHVHGRGMQEPLRLLGIAQGVVTRSTVLLPGQFRQLAEAECIIELPLGWTVPEPGSRLRLLPIVGQ